MIQAPIRNVRGETVGQIELDERVFGITPNRAVVHQAVVAQLANQRRGTHDTRTRGEVRGGGRKPWRQKGTGRARQGSIRAPHWRGGGVVFGPHPRSYHKDLPRKMRRLALRSALSDKLATATLTVLDALTLPAPRTREMVSLMRTLQLPPKTLFVDGNREEGVRRAAANLPHVRVVLPGGMCLLDVLNADHLVLTVSAVEELTRNLTASVRGWTPKLPAAAEVGAASATTAAGSAEPAAAAEGGEGEDHARL